MKIFEDLVFHQEETVPCTRTLKAVMKFENGYGVSVLTGDGALATVNKPYEIAVIKYGKDGSCEIVYPGAFNGDVITFLTADDVTHYMEIIQNFPPES